MKDLSWLSSLRQDRISQSSRNPGIAALMSFFVMGLGQIYAGHVDRGIVLLVAQIAGLGSGYSLYSKGMIYQFLSGFLGAGGIIAVSYIFSVGWILLWIYNIKDAYYLSLFAGFRDWFEIERMVIPMLNANYKTPLLAHQTHTMPQPYGEPDVPQEEAQTIEINHIPRVIPAEIDEEEAIPDLSVKKESGKKKDPDKSSRKKAPPIEVQPSTEFRFNLKFYGAIALFMILIGLLGYNKTPAAKTETTETGDPVAVHRDFSLAQGTFAQASSVAPIAPVVPMVAPAPSSEPKGPSVDEIFSIGMTQYKEGAFASAAEYFETGLKEQTARPEIWKALINAYRETGRTDLQEDALKRYLQTFSADTEEWVNLGKLQLDRKEFVEASRALSRATALAPNHIRANFFLGAIFRELGMPEDAIPCLQKALSGDPLNPECHREIGAAYLDARDFRLAKRHLEKVLSVNPQDDAARGLLAQIESLAPQNTMLIETVRHSPAIGLETVSTKNVPMELISPPLPTAEPLMVPTSSGKTEKPKKGPAVLYAAPGYENASPQDMQVVRREEPVRIEDGTMPGITSAIVPATSVPPSPKPEPVKSEAKNPPVAIPSIATPSLVTPSIATPTSQPISKPNALDSGHSSQPSLVTASEAGKVLYDADVAKAKPTPLSPISPPQASASPVIAEKGPSPDFKKVQTLAQFQKKASTPEFDELADTPAVETPAEAVASGSAAPAAEDLEDILAKGREKYLSGKWDQALPFFLRYLKKRENSTVYDFAGHTFEKIGMPEEAFESAFRAYELGKTDSKSLARLGKLAEQTGKFKEGATFLQKAVNQLPHRLDLRFNLVRCLREMGDSESALRELEAIMANGSGTYAIKRRVEKEMNAFQKPLSTKR